MNTEAVRAVEPLLPATFQLMQKTHTIFSAVVTAFLLGTAGADARIAGGVQNKPDNKAKNVPRIDSRQVTQRSSFNAKSSARNSGAKNNKRSNSPSASNKKSGSSKPSSNRSSVRDKNTSARVNPAPIAPRMTTSVSTNTASRSVQSRSSNHHPKSSSKSSKSNNSKKNDRKPTPKAAAAPEPRLLPRGLTIPASGTSPTQRKSPQGKGFKPSNSNASVATRTYAPKKQSYNRPASPHHHFVGKDTAYSRARTLNTVSSRAVLAQKWNSRHCQNASVWDRARKNSGHDHPSEYHHNFSNSLNYAYRPTAWGNNPWWDQHDRHDFHKGCWDYGWNDRYTHRHSLDRNFYPPGYSRPSSGLLGNLAWGLAGWGLGSIAYDTGYHTYNNPYPAPPVSYRGMSHSYAEPLAVVSASRDPEPELHVVTKEQLSASAMDQAREYFEQGDYVSALQQVDQAVAFTPSDPILHEFRALTLFALGRYGEAAGVLNPILASGPGWDWDTLIGFYASDEVYTRQLRRLEDFVEGNPASADSRFLLGYHYMVGGYLAEAREMFDQASQIEPNDSVAVQLRNLAESSMTVEETGEVDEPRGEMVDASIVAGTWRAMSADGQTITLTIGAEGNFTWDYEGAADGSVLSGEWTIDESGLLVLNDEDVQLTGIIEMEGTNTMHFVLAGTPEGDPGLTFERM